MKVYYMLAVALAAGFSAHAQAILRGSVRDAQTNAAIAGATISINSSSVVTITDSVGRFAVKLKKRAASVTVTSVGYVARQVNIASGTGEVAILLSPSNAILTTVEVLGQRQDRSVSTVSSRELQRFSALNLQDALNTVPGVTMQSRTPWGGQHIILRGYYPSVDNGRSNGENFAGLGYQLFMDNIPVTDATGTTVMDDIDFFNLGSVEVVKGPSPLYGSYIAGAVSLYTPKPAPGQTSLEDQAVAGSYGLFRTNTVFQVSNGKAEMRLNYGHQTFDGFRPNSASAKDYVTLTSNIAAGDRQTISTYFSYSSSREGLAGEIDSADFYARKPASNTFYVLNNSHVNIESFRAGITDRIRFNARFSNQTTLFVTGSGLNQAYAHGFSENQNVNFGGRTAFNYQSTGDAVLNGILGLAFQKTSQQTHSNFFLPFVSPPFTTSSPHNIPSASQNNALNYSLFTQWKFRLPARLQVTAGAGLNIIEFSTQNLLSAGTLFLNNPGIIKSFKPVLTPGISLNRTLGTAATAYASVNTGYAPPTLAQITNTAGAVNAGLQPEQATQYELGTRGSTLNNALAWNAALFDIEVTNRLVQQTANSITFYTNAGKQRNLGAEFFIGYAVVNNKEKPITLLRPWISYTWSHFKYLDFQSHGKSSAGDDTVLASFSGNRVAAVPENVFNAGIDFSSKNGFYANATYRFVDRAPITFDNAHFMKGYSLLSAKLGYQRALGRHLAMDLYAGADNLLGSTYYSFVFVGQNIQELGQGTDPYIPGGGGDGYILPAPYNATFYGGASLKYIF